MSTPLSSSSARRITIVGGGFSGVSAAVQLVHHTPFPIDITLIESRERVGPGLAYSTRDPDHRLNGPAWAHSVDPTDGAHFARWCEAHGVFERDPQALQDNGAAFVRRFEFGRYLEETLNKHAVWPKTGSTIETVRDRATGATDTGNGIAVLTEAGHAIVSDLVLVATGNAVPRLQAPLPATLAQLPSVIENPLDTWRLANIPKTARVLIIGSGLTSLDVLSTLRRQQYAGDIVVISRRGMRPHAQPTSTGPAETPSGRQQLDRLLSDPPAFITQAPPTVRAWLKALRTHIRADQAQGLSWHSAFDELRDSVWQLWPTLPATQQRRFLRKLRTWYDVHRFRSPPQNEAIVNQALADGQVVHRAARLLSLTPESGSAALSARYRLVPSGDERVEPFDVVVNCTGLDVAARTAANPFLHALVQQGWLQHDACNIGYAVDSQCRAVGTDGTVRPALRLIGPPTLGTFGDPAGAAFIAAQIHRMLPDVFRTLQRPGAAVHKPMVEPELDEV